MSALVRQRRMLDSFIRWTAAGSEGALLLEPPGVVGAVVPSVPNHSIPNSVAFESAEALEAAYPQIDAAFAEAGVRAWTVWVPTEDEAAGTLLAERGHVLDGEPEAMELDLDAFEPLELGDLDWDAAAEPAEFGRVNDLAYGHTAGEPAIQASIAAVDRDPRVRLYRARSHGQVVSVLGTIDAGDDAGLIYVATLPDARGRGLSSRLLSCAMVDARERGLRTSSLQASAMGAPVYERAGYRHLFRFGLWEKRASRPG